MAYIYVKSGLGTNTDTTQTTGYFATMQTGAFGSGNLTAANVYGSLYRANLQARDGDVILISDASEESSLSTSVIISYSVTITCVSDSNANEEVDGSLSSTAQTYCDDFGANTALKFVEIRNLHLKIYDDFSVASASLSLKNCALTFVSANGSSSIGINSDGGAAIFENVRATMVGPSVTLLNSGYGGSLVWRGGSIATSTNTSAVFSVFNRGAFFEIIDVDMSGVDNPYLYLGSGGVTSDFNFIIDLVNCKLPSTLTGFADEPFVSRGGKILRLVGCGVSAATSQYQFFSRLFGCDLEDDTSVYRTNTEAVFDTTKVSAKLITTSAVNNTNYISVVPIPWGRYVDLTEAATDTARLYFASNTALTQQDLWFDVCYADASDLASTKIATSKPANGFGATAHATTSGEWTGGLTYEYYVDVPLSGGGAGVPSITVNCAKASATVYIDPVFEFV